MVPLITNVKLDPADLFNWLFARRILFKTSWHKSLLLTIALSDEDSHPSEHSSDDESCCSCSRNIFHSSLFFFDLCGCFCLIFVGVSLFFVEYFVISFYCGSQCLIFFYLQSFFSVGLYSQFFLSTSPILILFLLWLFLVLACFFWVTLVLADAKKKIC